MGYWRGSYMGVSMYLRDGVWVLWVSMGRCEDVGMKTKKWCDCCSGSGYWSEVCCTRGVWMRETMLEDEHYRSAWWDNWVKLVSVITYRFGVTPLLCLVTLEIRFGT